MDPIPKKDSHPVIEFDSSVVTNTDDGRVHRTVLTYQLSSGEEMTHEVDVSLKEGQEHPEIKRQIEALNVGINNFHEKIRDRHSEEDASDPIRNV